MNRRTARLPLLPSLLVFAPLLAAGACGAPQGAKDGRPPAPSASASSSSASATPGGTRDVVVGKAPYVFFASASRIVGDALTLEDGSTLYAMEGGVRFLAKGSPVVYRSAESFVDDDFVAIRKTPDGKLAFLGASGSIYLADTPLGAFASARTPPGTIRRATAGRSAFFAITHAGELIRSTDAGASFAPVKLPRGGAMVIDLAIDDAGAGLALAAPEQLFETKDDGATFSLVPAPPSGVMRVHRADGGSVLVEATTAKTSKWGTSLSGELRAIVNDGARARLEARPGLRKRAATLTTSEAPLGYADAIAGGRGALIGSTYLELAVGDDETTPLALTRVELPSRATRTIATPIKGCTASVLAAAGSFYAIACTINAPGTDGAPDANELEVWASEDAGKAWKRVGWLAMAHEPRLWATAKGAIVISGACAATKDCRAPSALIRPPGGAFRALRPDATHAWDLEQVVSSGAGDRLYAYAVERDAEQIEAKPVLLVSTDAGARVVGKPLPWPDATAVSVRALAVEEGASAPTVHVFGTGDAMTRWTSRDDGASFDPLPLPLEYAGFSFGGRHGLATDGGLTFETPDLGKTWGVVTVPSASSFACSESGCLIGDVAFRAGFELAGPADARPPKPVDARSTLDAAAAWRCTVEPPAPKRALLREGQHALTAPRVGVAWIGTVADGPTGAAKVVEASAPSAAAPVALKEVPLFAAAQPGKGEAASTVRATPQGVWAVRYRFARDAAAAPTAKPGAPRPMPTARASSSAKPPTDKPPSGKPAAPPARKVDVEIAWYVAATGKVARATLAGAEGLEPDAHLLARKGYFDAKASAWIAPGYGLVVRPFASRHDEPLWLLSEAGKATALPPLAEPSSARRVAVRGAGALHLLSVNDNAGQVFVATLDDGAKAWKTRVIAAWPSSVGSPFGARLSPFAAGADASFAFAVGGDPRTPSRAFAIPLRDDGPIAPAPLPTQRELSNPARACDGAAGARAARARLSLPYGQGTRHPIVVVDGAQTRALATWDAIAELDLAAPAGACVAAFEASRPGYVSGEWLSVDPAALDRAVDVRETYEAGTRTLELRRASCVAAKEDPSSHAGAPGMWR